MTAKKNKEVVIIDNNPLSIASYAEEYPENFEKICKALDKKKKVKKNAETK